MSVRVVDSGLITAFGPGLPAVWNGLLAGRSAIKPLTRFSTDPFRCHCAAVVDGLSYRSGDSVVWQMLTQLLKKNDPRIPSDAPLLLASTTGEIDLLEQAVDAGETDCSESKLAVLFEKVCKRLGGSQEGAVYSSACASSTVALAQGAEMIERGECDCVAVVACDAVSEFVFSGFASLMALDPNGARPFDAGRQGLSVGEAAGFALLMSAERSERENRKALGTLAGWGMSNDANHMTGPSRDGSSLAKAMDLSIRRAGVSAEKISMICAHGTGTQYNDAMELKAFKRVFETLPPVFSVKGGTGHTMGAAGLVEVLLTLNAQKQKTVPPTVRLEQADQEAAGAVSSGAVSLACADWALSTNSGFGGVNAAVVLRRAAS
jgi:3-oxoacyl-[acyl-carrier-protein] synthase II